MANDPKVKYDLEERTSKYAEEIIKFSKKNSFKSNHQANYLTISAGWNQHWRQLL